MSRVHTTRTTTNMPRYLFLYTGTDVIHKECKDVAEFLAYSTYLGEIVKLGSGILKVAIFNDDGSSIKPAMHRSHLKQAVRDLEIKEQRPSFYSLYFRD